VVWGSVGCVVVVGQRSTAGWLELLGCGFDFLETHPAIIDQGHLEHVAKKLFSRVMRL